MQISAPNRCQLAREPRFVLFRSVVLKVVDIDPQGSIGQSKRSINSHEVEWRSLNGQGVNEKLLGSTGPMEPPTQNYC